MGYFGLAHVVEGTSDADGVVLTTTVYSAAEFEEGKALFFWGKGKRPEGLFPYARNTLFCTQELQRLKGYPVEERCGSGPGENADLVLVKNDFTSKDPADPIIFHYVLPERFVPCPDRKPLKTPSQPSIKILDDRFLTATFVATGHADVEFWMRRLEPTDAFDQYNLANLFDKPADDAANVRVEVNLGVLKFSFGPRG
jgi:hypothetical protein